MSTKEIQTRSLGCVHRGLLVRIQKHCGCGYDFSENTKDLLSPRNLLCTRGRKSKKPFDLVGVPTGFDSYLWEWQGDFSAVNQQVRVLPAASTVD